MRNIQDLINGIHDCPCGKDHICPTEAVEIGPRALASLPRLCASYSHILLVADQNTWAACGQAVATLLRAQAEDPLIYQTGDSPLIPNEAALEALSRAVSDRTDLIIGIGSGVINDLCKRVSNVKGLPYFIVATAPSMDGFASVGSALILGGMKITLNARPPKAIIADTKVLAQAPMELLQAGVGDIIGKFSCLNDWRLSALIRGEYFCQQVHDLVMESAQKVRSLAPAVIARDPEAVGALMEALVAVGIEMSFVGNSRPASGSEHHLSHFFEITGILHNAPYFSHGIDVVYSAVATAALRQKLITSRPVPQVFDRSAWEQNIRRIYTTSADGIIALQNKLGWYEAPDTQAVTEKWDQITALLAEAPGPEEMKEMLFSIGLDYSAFEALYGAEKIADALRYGKDLKDRYTVLWLAYQFSKVE